MSEITKTLLAAGLLAAGFFGASLFGSPDASDGVHRADDWSPQRLEPLEGGDLLPASAAATWDDQVSLAAHTDERASKERFAYEAGRHDLSGQPLTPLPGTNVEIPEIRSRPATAASERAGFNRSWNTPPTLDRQQVASLAPPPLLDARQMASAMQPTRFPDRPAGVGTSASGFAGFGQTPSIGSNTASNFPTASPWESSPQLSPLPQATAASTTSVREPVWHVVADGDSLPKIAERYLRDANRAREIYELNRDVLMSPDLLPIGAELRIPQHVTQNNTFDVFDVTGGRNAGFEPQSRLVPLPELPESVRTMPRARLQGPVSASTVMP